MLGMNLLQVLIISYETFRMHSSKFERPGSCDLLICDEAHRLKNDQTLTNKVHQFVMFILYTQFICSLGSTPALSLLKALKSIMCRHWLPFLVHGASSCQVPQCRYFFGILHPHPTQQKEKEKYLCWNNIFEI